MNAIAPSRSMLVGILRQRCPRCREGRMFRGAVTMNDPCPHCGLIFQREEGYFLGAMYVSYILSTALFAAIYCAWALVAGWFGIWAALLSIISYAPCIPAVFRYSRVLWIYWDRNAFPTEMSTGSYEKARVSEPTESMPPAVE